MCSLSCIRHTGVDVVAEFSTLVLEGCVDGGTLGDRRRF